MNNGLIGIFRGIKVTTVPDHTLTEIIIPESMVNHILKLQIENEKYKEEEWKSIFKEIIDK